MPRALTLVTRIALVLAGCLFCWTGLMALSFPDDLYSDAMKFEAPAHNRVEEVAIGLGFASYGLLLVCPPRLHVAAPIFYRVLVVATVALFACGFLRAMERVGGKMKLVLFFAPATVAVALVRAESRQANKTQQPTGAPSGAGG